MKKQMHGIAIILVSILLMIGFGNEPVFDFSFRWSVVFVIVGIAGAVMVFLPDKRQTAPAPADQTQRPNDETDR